ncbi:MAG: hypothetical protein CL457_03025 [Acidimicrobiaceae bacterium]|nr:hypothetical protein [Acidimicrobiaceae bacterium]
MLLLRQLDLGSKLKGENVFDGNLRSVVDKVLDPIGVVLWRLKVSADALTIVGILVAVAGAIVIGRGHMFAGFICLLLTGIPDALDGAVAKAAGTASVRGAFFDSVSDRITDSLLFSGIAWHLATEEPGRIMMLPVVLMATAMLVSYQRAKAESLGFDAKGGIMERAERFIVLALGLLFDEILIPVLWVMLVLTGITACQRFVKIWKQASKNMSPPIGDQT